MVTPTTCYRLISIHYMNIWCERWIYSVWVCMCISDIIYMEKCNILLPAVNLNVISSCTTVYLIVYYNIICSHECRHVRWYEILNLNHCTVPNWWSLVKYCSLRILRVIANVNEKRNFEIFYILSRIFYVVLSMKTELLYVSLSAYDGWERECQQNPFLGS